MSSQPLAPVTATEPMATAMAPAPMASSARRCSAHSSQTGQPCRATAVRGATVCIAHGAGAPAVKAKARERLERQKLGAFLAAQGIDEAAGDPHEIYVRHLTAADATAVRARELVADLDELTVTNHNGDQKLHVLLRLWGEWEDRVAKLAKIAHDNGFGAVQLAQSQAQTMMEAFTAAMNDPALNLSDEQKAVAKKAAARHLRTQAATE